MIDGMDALAKRHIKRRGLGVVGKGKNKATKTVEREFSYPARKRYLPEIINAFETKTADVKTLVKLITEHDLPREAIPTDKLNSLAGREG